LTGICGLTWVNGLARQSRLTGIDRWPGVGGPAGLARLRRARREVARRDRAWRHCLTLARAVRPGRRGRPEWPSRPLACIFRPAGRGRAAASWAREAAWARELAAGSGELARRLLPGVPGRPARGPGRRKARARRAPGRWSGPETAGDGGRTRESSGALPGESVAVRRAVIPRALAPGMPGRLSGRPRACRSRSLDRLRMLTLQMRGLRMRGLRMRALRVRRLRMAGLRVAEGHLAERHLAERSLAELLPCRLPASERARLRPLSGARHPRVLLRSLVLLAALRPAGPRLLPSRYRAARYRPAGHRAASHRTASHRSGVPACAQVLLRAEPRRPVRAGAAARSALVRGYGSPAGLRAAAGRVLLWAGATARPAACLPARITARPGAGLGLLRRPPREHSHSNDRKQPRERRHPAPGNPGYRGPNSAAGPGPEAGGK
jgi:hypothetical protein